MQDLLKGFIVRNDKNKLQCIIPDLERFSQNLWTTISKYRRENKIEVEKTQMKNEPAVNFQGRMYEILRNLKKQLGEA